jgi:hypothetical protein
MDSLELAWQTYEFHTEMAVEFEDKHTDLIERYRNFVSKNLNPSQSQKKWLLNRLNKSFNRILNTYVKQMDAVNDLIDLYNSDIEIPEERKLDKRSLYSLLNVTATLSEEMKIYRREINEVLR